METLSSSQLSFVSIPFPTVLMLMAGASWCGPVDFYVTLTYSTLGFLKGQCSEDFHELGSVFWNVSNVNTVAKYLNELFIWSVGRSSYI